jgi:4-hydroxybenzoate polyprenyltransferase
MFPRRRLLAYLQLVRISNVFTVISNVAMGFLFVNDSLFPLLGFTALLAASVCLYWAGMVLNDVFDVEADRIERPSRPIPAGTIPLRTAMCLGTFLTVAGIAAGWSACLVYHEPSSQSCRSGVIATLLAGCVWFYDGLAKRTLYGPLAMGTCRTLNVFLGMSLCPGPSEPFLFGFAASPWCVAAGIGLYVAGITWFARTEARLSRRGSLISGLCWMLAGLSVLSVFPWLGTPTRLSHKAIWPALLGLLAIPIVRRAASAIVSPTPAQVQAAVKSCLFSLIVLDASVCLAVRGPLYGAALLSLLVPTIILGHRFRAT